MHGRVGDLLRRFGTWITEKRQGVKGVKDGQLEIYSREANASGIEVTPISYNALYVKANTMLSVTMHLDFCILPSINYHATLGL